MPDPVGIRAAGLRQPFRARSRWASVGHAWQGLRDVWKTQLNFRIQVAAGAVTIVLGVWLHLVFIEWLWVSFAIGLVLFAELMNTAIEQTVDFVVGAQYDPFARQVKDVAAGCVLAAAVIAGVIGALTFGQHLLTG